MAKPISPAHVALGKAIRKLRERRFDESGKPLSQEALAAIAHVHRNYLGSVERGTTNVAYTNLLKLSAALGVTGSQLLARAERIAAKKS